MVITGILQVRNEEMSGHLARFLEWNSPVFDNLVAYDDCSTDQTVQILKNYGADVIENQFRLFRSELNIKNSLLKEALSRYPETNWILWLDADEVLLESRERIDLLLKDSELLGFDGIELPLVNLWRSENEYRTDSGFNDLVNVRFWRNNQELKFKTKPGLHHLMHPKGMKNIRQYDSLRILHFGFATDSNILKKFRTYQHSGQRGRNLWRLVDESDLIVQEISNYSESLGSRYTNFFSLINQDRTEEGLLPLIGQCRLEVTKDKFEKTPIVTLISLISVRGVAETSERARFRRS
jgi:glycosyltransferase involved in cell wall biosynthesis